MSSLLDKLPTILVLAVLVGMFVSLRKHSESARIRLWILAWSLIFLHFVVQVFEGGTGNLEALYECIDLVALELSGIVFLTSLTMIVENRKRAAWLFSALAVPAAFHGIAAQFDWHLRWPMAAALACFFGAAAAYTIYANRKASPFVVTLVAAFTLTGCWAVYHQIRGSADEGVIAILATAFGVCGVLYWRRFPRATPGVLTVVSGFFAWGSVFPVGSFLAQSHPNLHINPELWNVPKYFVAFGMILTLIEEKTRTIEEASQRQHSENELLQRFSRITSRLLGGTPPASLCNDIARTITETSHFRRAAVFLSGDDGVLTLAGSNGFSAEGEEMMRRRAAKWTAETIRRICTTGARVENNSFRVRLRTPGESDAGSPLNEFGGEVLVPMRSSRGVVLGCISLFSPKVAWRMDSSELAKLEMLAADLAVTMENARLHHQLVRSEKLAALGQLVAGVAHELNNPLTGILGYTELLADEVRSDGIQKRLGKLGNEARRMKRIVDGLLRFARQSHPSTRSSNFEATLRDAIQLREYHIRKLNIQVESHVEAELPDLAIGEDELKQVLLNLLNNAMDAVEESAERVISVGAARHGDRIVVSFQDTGPGFTDLNRAFDPFYTTKPVGKGTGLGLSICYGIARECGGDIHLANREPYGAAVSVDLPAAPTAVAAHSA